MRAPIASADLFAVESATASKVDVDFSVSSSRRAIRAPITSADLSAAESATDCNAEVDFSVSRVRRTRRPPIAIADLLVVELGDGLQRRGRLLGFLGKAREQPADRFGRSAAGRIGSRAQRGRRGFDLLADLPGQRAERANRLGGAGAHRGEQIVAAARQQCDESGYPLFERFLRAGSDARDRIGNLGAARAQVGDEFSALALEKLAQGVDLSRHQLSEVAATRGQGRLDPGDCGGDVATEGLPLPGQSRIDFVGDAFQRSPHGLAVGVDKSIERLGMDRHGPGEFRPAGLERLGAAGKRILHGLAVLADESVEPFGVGGHRPGEFGAAGVERLRTAGERISNSLAVSADQRFELFGVARQSSGEFGAAGVERLCALGKRAPHGLAVGVDEPIQCLRMVSHRLGEFDAAGVETTGEIPQRSNDFRLEPVRAAAEGAGHLVQVARHRSADAAGQIGERVGDDGGARLQRQRHLRGLGLYPFRDLTAAFAQDAGYLQRVLGEPFVERLARAPPSLDRCAGRAPRSTR